ncbi:Transcriptional regulator, AcrR family [hydrothermal vent metagenome]|uniref:Transcriptional regulator, AcrR family n=1 Tax=hydrothermal vent metagenome TaxID=652676 RepID=A0A3B0UAT5_9ZZZZ
MPVVSIPRKEQIEAVATDLFKVKGYAATSMRDIASQVGIEAASIYSHLKSKEQILIKICFRMGQEFMDGIKEVQGTNMSTKEKFKQAVISHVNIITGDIAASAVFWNEWRHLSEPLLSDFIAMQRAYEQAFKSIIDKGVSEGVFEVHDASFTVMAMLSSLNGIQKWHNYTLPPEELNEAFAHIFLKGLKK